LKTTIFLAHAELDHDFACELAEFLEFGCEVTCYCGDGMMEAGGDLIAKGEEGLAADILVLILSESSWPMRRPRQEWEPVLVDQAREAKAEVIALTLGDCPFPEVWRRRHFFDASRNRRAGMRLVKRWLWQRHRQQGFAPGTASSPDVFSQDLEPIYREIADVGGVGRASGEMASRFAAEAADEFDAVLWVPAHGRSLAQVSGELTAQLGATLEGTAEQNSQRIRDLLASRRCLLVLDAPEAEHADALIPGGRTSTLLTENPVRIADTPESFDYARELIAARRYAEAYDLLHCLLESGIAQEACARELTWICEHWGRTEEANALRFYYGPEPSAQLTLF
jgi:hypothetical protein